MGKLFKHIHDDALETEDSEYYKSCHICDTEGPVYAFRGFILNQDGSYDDEDPDAEIWAACECCIKGAKAARFIEYLTDDL